MAPGILREDSVSLPFKTTKPKLRATVSTEEEPVANTASYQDSAYEALSYQLQMRIKNKWSNFNNTITESDIYDIRNQGFMYFGDILIVHAENEVQFAHEYVGGWDAYRIGSQDQDVYECIGIYETMSEESMGIYIRENYMYDFIEEMYGRYTIAELMGAKDEFSFSEFICINL
jgi:hypothetical protein